MGVSISSVRIVPFNREVEHESKIRRAAEFLMSPAPLWLVKVLSHFSFDVLSQYSVDHISPEKKKMHDDIAGAQAMALGLLQFLQSPCGPGYVAAHSAETTEEFQRGLVEPLQIFLNGANPASASLVDKRGNILSGRGRASLPGTMPAKYVCAAVILETATFIAQKRLGAPRTTDLFKAATELWTSLIPLQGWGKSRLPSWKRYFEAAEDDRLVGLRQEVRRHLSIGMADIVRRK